MHPDDRPNPLIDLLALSLFWAFVTEPFRIDPQNRQQARVGFVPAFSMLAILTGFVALPAFAVATAIVSVVAGFGLSGLALVALYAVSPTFRAVANIIAAPFVFVGMSLFLGASAVASFTAFVAYRMARGLLNVVNDGADLFYKALRTAIFPVRYLNDAIETRYIAEINAEPEFNRASVARQKNALLNFLLTTELGAAFAITQTFISTTVYTALIPILGPAYALGGIIAISLFNLSKLNEWREERLNNFRISTLNGERREFWRTQERPLFNLGMQRTQGYRFGLHPEVAPRLGEISILWNNATRTDLTTAEQTNNIRTLLQRLQRDYSLYTRLSLIPEINRACERFANNTDGFIEASIADRFSQQLGLPANEDLVDSVFQEVFRTPVYVIPHGAHGEGAPAVRERYELSVLLKALERTDVTPNQRTSIMNLSTQIVFDAEAAERIKELKRVAREMTELAPQPPVLPSGGVPRTSIRQNVNDAAARLQTATEGLGAVSAMRLLGMT